MKKGDVDKKGDNEKWNEKENGNGEREDPVMGLGLPDDPVREVDEAVREIREEVEKRRERGQSVTLPAGGDLKAAVEEKLGKKL